MSSHLFGCFCELEVRFAGVLVIRDLYHLRSILGLLTLGNCHFVMEISSLKSEGQQLSGGVAVLIQVPEPTAWSSSCLSKRAEKVCSGPVSHPTTYRKTAQGPKEHYTSLFHVSAVGVL